MGMKPNPGSRNQWLESPFLSSKSLQAQGPIGEVENTWTVELWRPLRWISDFKLAVGMFQLNIGLVGWRSGKVRW